MAMKEFFKFFSGAAFWDMIVALWFLISGDYPVTFFGISFGMVGLIWISIIDAILVAVTVYFGWFYKKMEKRKPSRKPAKKATRKKRR